MLTHNVSTVQIFQTDQYKNFTMINGNRPLNENKIKKIIKEIESGNDMLQYYPIQVRVVDGKLQILDGQHRYMICKKLKRQVFYIIVHEKLEMHHIAKVNSNVEKWKLGDYINCYMNQGNVNYKILQEFLNKYKFTITVSLKLLSYGHPGNEGSDKHLAERFQQGLFEVKKLDEATAAADDVLKFKSFKYHTDTAFLIAIARISKAKLISIDDLASLVNNNIALLEKQSSYKNYVQNLEVIVNKNKHKRVVII